MLDIPVFILLFVLILIALVLGARALLVSKDMHPSSSYLAWFMIYVTLVNLQLWLGFVNPSNLYPNLILFFFPFELLPAPFFLLFTRSYLEIKPPNLKERVLLFTPFWIFFLVYLYLKWEAVGRGLSYEVAKGRYFPIVKFEEVVALVYGVIVIFVAFQNILSFEKTHGKKRFSQVVSRTRWIKKVIYIGAGLSALWMLSLLFDLVSVYRIGNYAYVPAWIGYLLFMIYIGYYGFQEASVLAERKKLKHFGKEAGIPSSFTNTALEPSTLKYFQELEHYMMHDKMYLNPYLDLNSLADKLAISPNYLSKIVNSHAKINFSDYINTYRISYAKKMLRATDYKDYNMLSIALESGFNSKSSFYAAFNKLLGQPPGHFRSHT